MLSRMMIRRAQEVKGAIFRTSPVIQHLQCNTQVRFYGHEVDELLLHARAGNFSERGVSREIMDDCSICQSYPDSTMIMVMQKMSNPWDKQWASLADSDASLE